MAQVAGGEGNALDPDVIVEESDPAAPVWVEDPRPHLEAVVEGARAKVEKLKAHLADAERALSDAEAALAAHGEG